MEIERKFTVKELPENLAQYPMQPIEQAYLCTDPVVRVRRKGEAFWLTCKGEGFLTREEYELPLSRESYQHLLAKADGMVISKKRYCIPCGAYTIELDVFGGALSPLVLAEVEFPSQEEALRFMPPVWFGREVTYDPAYTNAALSKRGMEKTE